MTLTEQEHGLNCAFLWRRHDLMMLLVYYCIRLLAFYDAQQRMGQLIER